MNRAWMLTTLFFVGCATTPDFTNPEIWSDPTMTRSVGTETVGSTYAEYSGWSGRGSLKTLAEELQRQLETKKDYVADTRRVSLMQNESGEPVVGVTFGDDDGFDANFAVTSHAYAQLARRCDVSIPTKFARNLWASQPKTACELINAQNERGPKKMLVRTLDGKARAFMSDRYRVIDNWDLAEVAMQIAKSQDLRILEASLTESHMRLKFTSADIVETIDEHRTGTSGCDHAEAEEVRCHSRLISSAESEQSYSGATARFFSPRIQIQDPKNEDHRQSRVPRSKQRERV